MAGMLSHLAAAGSHLPITLLHADLDESSFALRGQVLADIEALPGASAHVWYENGAQSSLPVDVHAGMLNLDEVKLPDDAIYYLCGPLPFMQAVFHTAPLSLEDERLGPSPSPWTPTRT